jgi:hypothetical protein
MTAHSRSSVFGEQLPALIEETVSSPTQEEQGRG